MATPDDVPTRGPAPPTTACVRLVVNGRVQECEVDTRSVLADTLRDVCGLTGTKVGCAQGTCGACTVHMAGRPTLSCLVLTVAADGAEITSIEGLGDEAQLHPLQSAFIAQDALQCGFCTPGQIMSAVACVADGATGSRAEVAEYMSGNLCRCAAYVQIVDAVLSVANDNGGEGE